MSQLIPTHDDGVGVEGRRAGWRALPMQGRTFDLGGNPVLDLAASSVHVSSVRIAYESLSGETDPLEAHAPGSSGLQNHGDGSYRWDRATETPWAGTRRLSQLDLGDREPDGAPVYRTAAFTFTR